MIFFIFLELVHNIVLLEVKIHLERSVWNCPRAISERTGSLGTVGGAGVDSPIRESLWDLPSYTCAHLFFCIFASLPIKLITDK